MKLDLTQILRAQLGNTITAVPCSIDLEDVLAFNDLQFAEFDVESLFRANRTIAVTWETADVLEKRPDLTDDEAWEVLQAAEQAHDSDYGITWDVIEAIAEELFPTNDAGATS